LINDRTHRRDTPCNFLGASPLSNSSAMIKSHPSAMSSFRRERAEGLRRAAIDSALKRARRKSVPLARFIAVNSARFVLRAKNARSCTRRSGNSRRSTRVIRLRERPTVSLPPPPSLSLYLSPSFVIGKARVTAKFHRIAVTAPRWIPSRGTRCALDEANWISSHSARISNLV